MPPVEKDGLSMNFPDEPDIIHASQQLVQIRFLQVRYSFSLSRQLRDRVARSFQVKMFTQLKMLGKVP